MKFHFERTIFLIKFHYTIYVLVIITLYTDLYSLAAKDFLGKSKIISFSSIIFSLDAGAHTTRQSGGKRGGGGGSAWGPAFVRS